jgi:hypothetical protein
MDRRQHGRCRVCRRVFAYRHGWDAEDVELDVATCWTHTYANVVRVRAERAAEGHGRDWQDAERVVDRVWARRGHTRRTVGRDSFVGAVADAFAYARTSPRSIEDAVRDHILRVPGVVAVDAVEVDVRRGLVNVRVRTTAVVDGVTFSTTVGAAA